MEGYRRHQLPNGLRIIHRHDPCTVMAAVDVIYNVGARDEDPNLTGMAHLFEHLMFGGSANIPDFDAATERAGGWNNAWTSNDFTNFYTVMPAVNAESAFRLESDRMLALSFNPKVLEVQRNVVIEEFKETCLNQPYGDLPHHLRSLVYRVHPYRWPTIGLTPEHIRHVTDEDVRSWFYSHYSPDNAVLAVTGALDFDRAVELAERWFGPIERRPLAPRSHQQEPPCTEPRSLVVTGPVPQTVIVMAWLMPGINHPDYPVADLISDVLANGMSSRFYRRLLMGTDIFTEIDASVSGADEPGMFLIQARLRESGPDAEKRAIDAIRTELDRLMADGPEPHEVERAVNKFESAMTFGNIQYVPQAMNLAQWEISGIEPSGIVPAYRAVTPADIQRVARAMLRPEAASTLVYRPAQ